jgi:hypothetical protein
LHFCVVSHLSSLFQEDFWSNAKVWSWPIALDVWQISKQKYDDGNWRQRVRTLCLNESFMLNIWSENCKKQSSSSGAVVVGSEITINQDYFGWSG